MANDERSALSRFLFPDFTWWYFLRVALVAAAAFLFFSFVCRPFIIDGASMLPTYPSSGVLFSWNVPYWFGTPKRGDVVIARINHNKSYLKRVVALPGDRVQWRSGALYVNGEPQHEPYVVYPCEWNNEEVVVAPGYVFVVGDNRSMPQREHNHGQISVKRIIGRALW